MNKYLFIIVFMLLAHGGFSGVIVHWDFGNAPDRGFYWSEDGVFGISTATIAPNPQGHIVYWSSGDPMILGTRFTIETTAMAYYQNLISYIYGTQAFSIYSRVDDSLANFSVLIAGSEYTFSSGDLHYDEISHFAMVKEEEWVGFYLNGDLICDIILFENISIQFESHIYDPRRPSQGFYINAIGSDSEFRISEEALSPKDFLNYYAAVPEPGTLGLLGFGVYVLSLRQRKTRKRSTPAA